uniref:Uncharacterized protein n=1 Tax=Panagrolaimus sp. PS1159 TaxID=55785 RepID=A0AC35FQT7_9BILA
ITFIWFKYIYSFHKVLVGRPQAWKYSTIKKIEKEKSKRGRKRMRWRLFLLCLLPFKSAVYTGILKKM